MGASEGFTGPRVRLVSESQQEFNGIRYYRSGQYFSNSSQKLERRLHRAVWLAHNGAIPDGCHIHHIDGDRSNNQIENLQCIAASSHGEHHGHERSDEIAAMGRKYQHRTKSWHASDEGREWHREHYAATAPAFRGTFPATCSACGKGFDAKLSVKSSASVYCSPACKAHARRQSGVDDVDRQCIQCGTGFRANRYSTRKRCDGCFPARRSGRSLPDGS